MTIHHRSSNGPTPGLVRLLPAALLLAAAAGVRAQESTTSGSAFLNVAPNVPAVYGYVNDPEGKAIAQAQVEVYLRSEFRTDYAVTDGQGFYLIILPQRSDFWEVRVKAEGFYAVSTTASVYRRERLDFTLRPDPRPHERFVPETKVRVRARKTMQQGLERARAGKREEALALLREAVAIDPDYGAGYNNLGVNLRLAGDLSAAEQAFRRAVALDPLDYYSHFNLGTLLYDTGRFHEAAPLFERAALADPTSPAAEAMLGRAYLALGLGRRALQHLQEAQRMAGAAADLTLEISDAYAMAGDLEAALTAKEKWLHAHAGDPRAGQVGATVARIQDKLAADKPQ